MTIMTISLFRKMKVLPFNYLGFLPRVGDNVEPA